MPEPLVKPKRVSERIDKPAPGEEADAETL
jgi:hypothetical protein